MSADDAAVAYRPGRLDDVPRIEELLRAAHLPPRLIVEFIETFVLAESDGAVVGAGGLEIYEDSAVLRSVVVDEALRGRGIGRRIALALIELAREASVRDLYLFTYDSGPFWQKLGFEDLDLSQWREPAHRCWQWQYVSSRLADFRREGLHDMWQALA